MKRVVYLYLWAIAECSLLLFSSFTTASGLLVISPHPDDDIIMAAGLIANAKARGDQVKVVFMTNGDLNSEVTGLIRARESVTAQTKNLGTDEDDLIFLGYPDGGLQPIYQNYPQSTDRYSASTNRSTTYGERGLGRADYHRYKFGESALYNRANIAADLESIITAYLPDHIVTTAEYDKHPDHATTFYVVKEALERVIIAQPAYRPALYKSIVWADSIHQAAVWPALLNPHAAHTPPHNLPAELAWSDRESIDVPTTMQTNNLAHNLKYRAIKDHVSQGSGSIFLQRFVHRDEIFWPVSIAGTTLPPTAAAGANRRVSGGVRVFLNGDGSFDRVGDKLTYQWRQLSGPPITLSDAHIANPHFQTPSHLSQQEIFSFELVVGDGSHQSLPDLVEITVVPMPKWLSWIR